MKKGLSLALFTPFISILMLIAVFVASCSWVSEAAKKFKIAEEERQRTSAQGSRALAVDVVPAAFRPWVEKAGSLCAEYPPAVIAAQIEAESSWNPTAVNTQSGARGISQFMPGTWDAVGRDENGNGKDPFDPADVIMAQGRYACQLAAQVKQMQAGTWGTKCWNEAQGGLMSPPVPGEVRGGLLELTIAAYHAGPCGVRVHRGIPPYKDTQAYVRTVIDLVEKYSAPLPTPVDDPLLTGDFVRNVLSIARAQIGLPYVWGGGSKDGPDMGSRAEPNAEGEIGFDCSGLVLYVFYQATKHLPADKRMIMSPPAHAQAQYGTPVARNDMRAGDVVAFRNKGTSIYTHIAIYSGNDMFIEAPRDPLYAREVSISVYANMDWMIRRYSVSGYVSP